MLGSYLVEKNISKSLIVSIFVLIITYGYFFNKSTEKIIVSNFEEKKAKNAFKELSNNLQQEVVKATAELQAGKVKVESALEVEKQAREELQKLNQAKTEFLNLASHQLRTPISVIKGIASMIKEGSFEKFPKEKQATFIEGLYDKALKLEDIINDILNASEMTSTKFKVTPDHAQWIDPESFIKELASGFEPKLAERQIDLKINIEKILLPKILCQENFLKDAIGNLIENAIKYTPSAKADSYTRNIREGKAEIIVFIYQKDNEVVFKIQDNGIGVPKEEIANIFKKFQRGSNARDMYTDGSGLGLFIVKEIIEGHGGRVWAESELGKGSSFFASLPTNPPKDINIKATIIERAGESAQKTNA
ncbi:MAG: HAMP domain-containing sensor histidine kinase [Candidatus Portnoybacteria bacterium]|nr:HAMP domain-containing sensor histidine kinase [Candidatus Portnoybacteria bacterium]MDD4982383.1 HAMP domain-containing sensor histidine kinase [Candidatus Portnoybacteria bacterium]